MIINKAPFSHYLLWILAFLAVKRQNLIGACNSLVGQRDYLARLKLSTDDLKSDTVLKFFAHGASHPKCRNLTLICFVVEQILLVVVKC